MYRQFDHHGDDPQESRLDPQKIAALLFGALLLIITAVGVSLVLLGSPPSQLAAPGSPDPSLSPSATPTEQAVVPTVPPPSQPPVVVVDHLPSPSPTPDTPPQPSQPSASPTESPKSPPPTEAPPSLAPGAPTPSPLPTPEGDAMQRPTVINSIPASTAIDTRGATSQATDPDCSGAGPTVWFSFTPSQSMTIAATTFGSGYDTTLYAGTRSGATGFELLDCNDDAGDQVQSALRLDVRAGVTYLFMVGSYAGWSGGDLVFNLGPASPPPSIVLTIDQSGTFDELGRAELTGTATCSSRVDNLSIEVTLRQRVGRQIFYGYGYTSLSRCSGRTRQWSTRVTSYDGTFGEEPATATVEAYLCDAFDCTSAQLEQSVLLRSNAPASSSPSPTVSPSPDPSVEPDPAPAEPPDEAPAEAPGGGG